MLPHFPDNTISEQTVIDNDSCVLIMPTQPIYPYHFLLIPKRKQAHTFNDLTIDELGGVQDLAKRAIKAFEGASDFHYSGYNLFCNNGSLHANQHVDQFHMHLFVRSHDERVSPYDLMNQHKCWVSKDTEEWQEHLRKMQLLIK